MIKLVKKTTIIFVITVFFLETFGVILSNLKIIPRGSPAVISIFAHDSWSYWHPKNITFKHHYNTCWGPSKITFNNMGSRSTQDVQIKKTKPRIGLLGDSMIEMVHVNDGKDITSLLQQRFPNFEIINFSSRAMGLYDHLDIYRNLIKKYKVDYLFYYPTENDLYNNFIESNNPKKVFNQPLFYFDETKNKVIKLDRNSEKMEEYFSFYNNFKRSKLILYLKEYSYTFKMYWHTKFLIRNNKVSKIKFGLEEYNEKKKILHKQEKVYRHIMDEFVSEIEKDDVKLTTILNYKGYLFYEEKNLPLNRKIRLQRFNIIKDLWTKYNEAYYDLGEAKNFIELNKNNIVKPFINLGHTCDDHYSKFGSEFITNITIKYINNYIKEY